MKSTPLRRTAFRPRRRAVPVDPRVRRAVFEREGYRCARCGTGTGRFAVHHRLPRRLGGSRRPDVASVSNLLLLCEPCHLTVESLRAVSYAHGLLLPDGADPASVPVLLRGTRRVLLTTDGRYEEAVA